MGEAATFLSFRSLYVFFLKLAVHGAGAWLGYPVRCGVRILDRHGG